MSAFIQQPDACVPEGLATLKVLMPRQASVDVRLLLVSHTDSVTIDGEFVPVVDYIYAGVRVATESDPTHPSPKTFYWGRYLDAMPVEAVRTLPQYEWWQPDPDPTSQLTFTDALPVWLAINVRAGFAWPQLWRTDPKAAGGLPLLAGPRLNAAPAPYANLINTLDGREPPSPNVGWQSRIAVDGYNTGGGGLGWVDLDDWRWGDIAPPPVPPYPFAPYFGSLEFGPGSVGQLRIGQ